MSECPCCSPPWDLWRPEPSETAGDVPWSGDQANKFYLTSGEFSSTLKTSGAASLKPGGTLLFGHHWDGSYTYYKDPTNDITTPRFPELMKSSGQFTSTVSDSRQYTGITSGAPEMYGGITGDGTNTPWILRSIFLGIHTGKDAFMLTSGKFTGTIKTSLSFSYTTGSPNDFAGMSWDGTDTIVNYQLVNKYYRYSGQFTSTVKVSVTDIGTLAYGLCWNGENTLSDDITGFGAFLRLSSGKLTTTVKTSIDVSSVDNQPRGINTNRTNIG